MDRRTGRDQARRQRNPDSGTSVPRRQKSSVVMINPSGDGTGLPEAAGEDPYMVKPNPGPAGTFCTFGGAVFQERRRAANAGRYASRDQPANARQAGILPAVRPGSPPAIQRGAGISQKTDPIDAKRWPTPYNPKDGRHLSRSRPPALEPRGSKQQKRSVSQRRRRRPCSGSQKTPPPAAPASRATRPQVQSGVRNGPPRPVRSDPAARPPPPAPTPARSPCGGRSEYKGIVRPRHGVSGPPQSGKPRQGRV